MDEKRAMKDLADAMTAIAADAMLGLLIDAASSGTALTASLPRFPDLRTRVSRKQLDGQLAE